MHEDLINKTLDFNIQCGAPHCTEACDLPNINGDMLPIRLGTQRSKCGTSPTQTVISNQPTKTSSPTLDIDTV